MLPREIFYEDKLCKVELERTEIGYFMHCTIHKWSRETYKELLSIWAELLVTAEEEGFTEIYAGVDNSKLYNFASMFGFEATESYCRTGAKESLIMKYKIED